jgi:GNAT superfamily N-acetyltransferase
MADGIILKPLEAASLDQVSRFRMSADEDKPLEIFIRQHAYKSAKANLTQTYVAKLEGDKKVIGYVSLMCAEVGLEKTYDIADKAGADRYDYHPAVRVARLAAADGFRGQGIGPALVEMAIGIVLTKIMPFAGCRFIILDAKSKSIAFYKRLGFRLLDTTENRTAPMPLMFMDLKPLADLLAIPSA